MPRAKQSDKEAKPARVERTSARVASKAGAILRDPKSSRQAKSVAASALTNAPDKPKKTKAALLAKATAPRKAVDVAVTAEMREAAALDRASRRELHQPAETVVGRFYEITQKDGAQIVGELIDDSKGIQTVEPWVEGRPVGEEGRIETNFKTRNVREVSRELAFELSHSHLHGN